MNIGGILLDSLISTSAYFSHMEEILMPILRPIVVLPLVRHSLHLPPSPNQISFSTLFLKCWVVAQ